MATVKMIWEWVMLNYQNVFYLLMAVVSVGEIVVRFTATEKDDGFVQRIGSIIKSVMDWLKIPNRSSNSE